MDGKWIPKLKALHKKTRGKTSGFCEIDPGDALNLCLNYSFKKIFEIYFFQYGPSPYFCTPSKKGV
jgi:hypothetical protein